MKDRTAAEARQAWWDEWWEADYSWTGLARKRWSGWVVLPNGDVARKSDAEGRPATLQDLWRAEEGRLEAGWTRVHLPPAWRDGDLAKAAWTEAEMARIDESVRDALARLPPGAFDPREVSSGETTRTVSPTAEWGLPLDGAVLFGITPAMRSLSDLRGSRLAFLEDVNLANDALNIGLTSALLEKSLTIEDVEAGTIRLRSTIVMRQLFAVGRAFTSMQVFRTRIYGDVTFDDLKGFREIRISGSGIAGSATFEEVEGKRIRLAKVRIGGGLSLLSLQADDIEIADCRVAENVLIQRVQCRQVEARRVQVEGEATLLDVAWGSELDFREARFARGFTLHEASGEAVDFSGAVFNGRADFHDAVFRHEASFARARFDAAVSFAGVTWSEDGGHLQGAFRETQFTSFVDFRGSSFRYFSAFDGANFKSEVRFDRHVFADDRALNQSLALSHEAEYRVSLEHGFRALKQAAENVRDRMLEQTFYRYELIVRRNHPATGIQERILSHLYGLASAYGASFTRPVVVAFFLWVLFSLVYLGVAAGTGAPAAAGLGWSGTLHSAVAEVLNLSARSMFNLFGVWSLRPPSPEHAATLEAQLLHGDPTVGLGVRLLSSLQSVLAGILLFLAALAARRRFQIS